MQQVKVRTQEELQKKKKKKCVCPWGKIKTEHGNYLKKNGGERENKQNHRTAERRQHSPGTSPSYVHSWSYETVSNTRLSSPRLWHSRGNSAPLCLAGVKIALRTAEWQWPNRTGPPRRFVRLPRNISLKQTRAGRARHLSKRLAARGRGSRLAQATLCICLPRG